MLGPFDVEDMLRLQREEIVRRLARHGEAGSEPAVLVRVRMARLLRGLADRLDPRATPRRRPAAD